jgi:hypothetical protein
MLRVGLRVGLPLCGRSTQLLYVRHRRPDVGATRWQDRRGGAWLLHCVHTPQALSAGRAVSAGSYDIMAALLPGRRCAHRRCQRARSRWGRARPAPARLRACAASAGRRPSASLIRPTQRPRPSLIRPTWRWTPRLPRSGRRTSRRSCARRSAQSCRRARPSPHPARVLYMAGGRASLPRAVCAVLLAASAGAAWRWADMPSLGARRLAACGLPRGCSMGQGSSRQGLSDVACVSDQTRLLQVIPAEQAVAGLRGPPSS